MHAALLLESPAKALPIQSVSETTSSLTLVCFVNFEKKDVKRPLFFCFSGTASRSVCTRDLVFTRSFGPSSCRYNRADRAVCTVGRNVVDSLAKDVNDALGVALDGDGADFFVWLEDTDEAFEGVGDDGTDGVVGAGLAGVSTEAVDAAADFFFLGFFFFFFLASPFSPPSSTSSQVTS
jgi:hypothetical protein